MSDKTEFLRRRIQSISPVAWEKLDRLDSLTPTTATQILSVVLEFACKSQSVSSINAGRMAFGKIPRKWLSQHLTDTVSSVLDLTDEWEYRRLLELLPLMPEMSLYYIELGLRSRSADIVSAAKEFGSPK